ncbi:MAG: ABC transporter substrate-binding protein [Thermomicrobiales bacterium]|jgi:sn-glycerol 3-phosphate transport system substrate-binding protein|nr:ABC transporter substrate-binding protein [Thermomicrobiales bacterium]
MTYTDDARPGKRLSRRMVLKAGLGAAATGALAALLAACGNTATATPAGGTGGTSGGTSATKPAATTAAGGGGGGGAATATVSGALPTQPATPKPPKNASAMKLEWWHAMGGTNGKIVTDLCDQFNDSQSDIYVQPIYQGSYDDTINKFKAALPAKTVPHIIQVYDIGQRFMIDSKATDPMQSFVDADKFDLTQYEPAILNYYTVDKKLNAMPFNTSNPILYYNKKAFKDAGLDAEKPPKTWEDIEAAAGKLVKKDSGGKVTQYGIAIAIYGWFFEQWLATQNAVYADPDNGRGANRATKVVYNSDAGTKVLDWWKGLIDKGVATNLGRNTSDTQKAFGAGQLPITVDSTAALRGIVAAAGSNFEVGTAYMPRPAATVDQGGIIMGGAANYILKDKATNEKQAAWKFIQFLSQPKQQAYWHINTGYFPIRKDTYDLPEEVANFQKYPQFKTAVDQLHDTKLTPATSGAVIGVFPQARQSTENAIEEVILGKSAAKAALDKSTSDVNQQLDLYNQSVK